MSAGTRRSWSSSRGSRCLGARCPGARGFAARLLLVVAASALGAAAPRAQVIVDFEDVHGACCVEDEVQGPSVVAAGPVTLTTPGFTTCVGSALTGLGSDGLRVMTSSAGTTLQFATPITDLWLRCLRASPITGPAVYEVTGLGPTFTFGLPNGTIVPLHWKSATPTSAVTIRLITGGLGAVLVTLDDVRTLPLPAGCVAWWGAEPATNGMFEDTVSYHEGTLVGTAALVPGAGGHVLRTGGDGSVTVPDDDALDFGPPGPGDTGDVSITCWFRFDTAYQSFSIVKWQGLDGWAFGVDMTPPPVSLFSVKFVDHFIGADFPYQPPGLDVYAWHHVAITIDAELDKGLACYVDGVFLGLTWSDFIALNPNNPHPLEIGLGGIPGVRLDDIGIFHRVLTPAEIAVLAAAVPPPDEPWTELGQGLAGSAGTPCLAGSGVLAEGIPVSLRLAKAKHDALATLVIGLDRIDLPFKGGVMVPAPDVLIPGLPVDSFGELTIGSDFPAGVPPGTPIWFQCWIPDTAAPNNFAASVAVQGIAD